MLRRRRGALLFTFLLAAGMVYYYFAVFLPYSRAIREAHQAGTGYAFGADYYPVWLASRECVLQRRDPYSRELTREIQRNLFGREFDAGNPGDPAAGYRAFFYPAFVALFGLPLAWLPFSAARLMLAVLLPCLTAASVLLWSRALRWRGSPTALTIFIVLALTSYPALEGIFAEQAGLIAGFLLAAAMAALAANQQWLAGCLLAGATAKPQMSILLILYLMIWALTKWKERWKLAASFGTTLAALTFFPMLVWPNWIYNWLQALANYRHYSQPPLVGYLFGRSAGVVLTGLLLAGSVGLAWRQRRASAQSAEFALVVALLLVVTTVTLLPEHAVYDQVILLPGILLIAQSGREMRARSAVFSWLLALGAGTLFWPWVAAWFVVFIRTVAPGFGRELLFLPLRTVAAIPFVLLGLLFMMERVQIHTLDSRDAD